MDMSSSSLNAVSAEEFVPVARLLKRIFKQRIDDRAINHLAAGSGTKPIEYDDVDVERDQVNRAISEYAIDSAGMGRAKCNDVVHVAEQVRRTVERLERIAERIAI